MPQALININENSNRVLNVVKAKYDLKDKSMAVEWLIDFYLDQQEDPELRPEFIRKIQRMEKEGKWIHYENVAALRKEIETTALRTKVKKNSR